MLTHQDPTYQSATFSTRKHEARVAVVTVDGELDFTNVMELIGAATHAAVDSSRIVIDLSGVEFFGTAGYAALHTLSERYTAQQTPWSVVPSRNVNRVVEICDIDTVVPLRASLAVALESA